MSCHHDCQHHVYRHHGLKHSASQRPQNMHDSLLKSFLACAHLHLQRGGLSALLREGEGGKERDLVGGWPSASLPPSTFSALPGLSPTCLPLQRSPGPPPVLCRAAHCHWTHTPQAFRKPALRSQTWTASPGQSKPHGHRTPQQPQQHKLCSGEGSRGSVLVQP